MHACFCYKMIQIVLKKYYTSQQRVSLISPEPLNPALHKVLIPSLVIARIVRALSKVRSPMTFVLKTIV